MGRTAIVIAHENKHYVVRVKDFQEKTLIIADFDRKSKWLLLATGYWLEVGYLKKNVISSATFHLSLQYLLSTDYCQLSTKLFTTFVQQLEIYAD